MEIWLWLLTILVLIYAVTVAVSYKLCFEGLILYLIKQGYTPPTKKELAKCGKAYLLSSFGIKN